MCVYLKAHVNLLDITYVHYKKMYRNVLTIDKYLCVIITLTLLMPDNFFFKKSISSICFPLSIFNVI